MLRILLLLTVAVLIPDVASACSCVIGQVPVVDIAGTGAVIPRQTPDSPPPPLGLSYVPDQPFTIPADWRGLFAIGKVLEIRRDTPMNVVTIQVIEGLFNAQTGTNITISTNIDEGACGYQFLQSRDYVIASNWENAIILPATSRGIQVVNYCGMTRELNTREADKALEEIRKAIARRATR
jgi:hypothetical protein